METVIRIIAVFGVAFSVSDLDGPFDIFHKLRKKITEGKYPEWVTRGITCYVCVSFWVGLPLALIDGPSSWLACVGFSAVIARISDHA